LFGGATGNFVQGNYIGSNITGDSDLGNGEFEPSGVGAGVFVNGGNENTIGGTVSGAGNLISGNRQGIILGFTDGATQNVVQGNLIGTNSSGTAALCNSNSGVWISGGSNNVIGGTTTAARNIISGNGGGICGNGGNVSINASFLNQSASGNRVEGNFIGTNRNGDDIIGGGAVLLGTASNTVTATDNVIGGTAPGAGNVISTGGVAVQIGGRASNNLVQGNIIGGGVTGSLPLPGGFGVIVEDGASHNTIGGTDASARNLVINHSIDGILVRGITTTQNVIQGNQLGTETLGNGTGVHILDAPRNQIGGTVSGAG
jgi:titin